MKQNAKTRLRRLDNLTNNVSSCSPTSERPLQTPAEARDPEEAEDAGMFNTLVVFFLLSLAGMFASLSVMKTLKDMIYATPPRQSLTLRRSAYARITEYAQTLGNDSGTSILEQ